MSKSEDVKTLFRRFGGSASSYQEVVSRDQVTEAEEKWPMLGNIRPSNSQEAPSVRRVSVGFGAASGVRQGLAEPALPPLLAPSPPPPPLKDRPLAAAQSPAQDANLFSGFLAPKGGRAGAGHVAAPASEASPRAGLFDGFKASSAPPPATETPLTRLFSAAVVPVQAATPVSPTVSTSLAGAFGRMTNPPPAKSKTLAPAPTPATARQPDQGGGLNELFGRLVAPPPPPPPAPKKGGRSSKKAIKW
jgi:hypothetical protein